MRTTRHRRPPVDTLWETEQAQVARRVRELERRAAAHAAEAEDRDPQLAVFWRERVDRMRRVREQLNY